ncbi:hypothetical protein ACVXHA_19990 [Escherichia coli]
MAANYRAKSGGKMAAVKKNQDAFWEQMVNNELAAKKALSPAAILALRKSTPTKSWRLTSSQAEIYR